MRLTEKLKKKKNRILSIHQQILFIFFFYQHYFKTMSEKSTGGGSVSAENTPVLAPKREKKSNSDRPFLTLRLPSDNFKTSRDTRREVN